MRGLGDQGAMICHDIGWQRKTVNINCSWFHDKYIYNIYIYNIYIYIYNIYIYTLTNQTLKFLIKWFEVFEETRFAVLLSAHFTKVWCNDLIFFPGSRCSLTDHAKFVSHTGRSNPLKNNGLIRVKYGFSTGSVRVWKTRGFGTNPRFLC